MNDFRNLGSSDLRVFPLNLGGNVFGWTADRDQSFAVLDAYVAAAGNFADDLAHPTQDIVSPDTGPGEVRRIRNNCAVIPVEIPGVIGVSATGNLRLKSSYLNYGSGVIQVAAPGGDISLQTTPAAPNGLVLSTIQPGWFLE